MTETDFKKKQNEFLEKEALLLDQLPQEFRGPLSYKAYEDGHSGGEEEILIELQGLVEMLKEPVAQFEKRLKNEHNH